jgi:hypothetical protein
MYISDVPLRNCLRCGEIFSPKKDEKYCEKCCDLSCFGTFHNHRWKECLGCHAHFNCESTSSNKK